MDTTERDGAAVRLPPPVVYALALLAGALLHVLLAPFPVGLPLALRLVLGIAIAVGGAAMIAAAFGHFRRTRQDPTPWTSTPEVLSTGIYRWTRNPMYVGLALILLGVGIAWGNGWLIVLVPVVLAVIYRTAVRHEEAYLERKFGETYLSYKRSVRRWL